LCGGPAREIYIAKNQTDLIDIVTDYQASKRLVKVVGGLSNILFSDAGYDGLLVINRSSSMRVERRDDQVLVTVGSGMKLDEFVNKTAQLNLTGMEWATKIPGSVGGAIYGNAGAYEGDIAHVLVSVQLLTEDNRLITLSNKEMKFGYRISVLKSGEIKGTLVSATFTLKVGDPLLIQEKIAEISEKRMKFNFGEKGSLGSVFKNPPGNYAGKLITECGLRGKRIGNVQIADFHGNIFVTYPGVRSSEFLSMMNIVKTEVHKQFGIDLTSEIEVQ
jgi:UDP-N-acetylmuramate dehydrogenase